MHTHKSHIDIISYRNPVSAAAKVHISIIICIPFSLPQILAAELNMPDSKSSAPKLASSTYCVGGH